jgi:hypothetical protein
MKTDPWLLIILILIMTDSLVASLLYDSWTSVVSNKVLLGFQLSLHGIFMICHLLRLDIKRMFRFYQFSLFWLIRLAVLLLCGIPRVQSSTASTYWNIGYPKVFIGFHIIGSIFFYSLNLNRYLLLNEPSLL